MLVVLSFALVGISAYIGVSNTQRQMTSTVTETTVTTVTSTYALLAGTGQRGATYDGDFLFQVYVDRSAYQYGEPVIVYYNLTYIGETRANTTVEFYGFRLRVWNSTHSLIGSTTWLQLLFSFPANYGQGMSGRAVISDGSVTFYWRGEPWGKGSILPFSPNSVYNLSGNVEFKWSGNAYNMTAPPLQIRITQ